MGSVSLHSVVNLVLQLGLGDVVSVAGAAGAGGAAALPPRILNITVPQVGHLPLMALRPFFMVSSTASTISFLALHLTQYPSGIKIFLRRGCMRRRSHE
jgi:ABC-type uncharacterized transport system ATPase subunit